MNAKKQEKLLFTDINSNIEQPIKDNHRLQIKEEHNPIIYDIKWIPPSCFSSSFDDNKWIGLNLNKSRGTNESLNFSTIPSQWVEYIKKVFCILEQMQFHGSINVSAFGSFARYFATLKHFLNNIQTLQINELKNITKDDFRKIYLDYSTNNSVSSNSTYIRVLSKLYEYGPNGHKFFEDGLLFNPLNDEFLIGHSKNSNPVGETEIIDEDSAHLLISSAIDWVLNKKDDLLTLIELSKIFTAKKINKNETKGTSMKSSLTFVQARKVLHSNVELYNKFIKVRKNFHQDLYLYLELGHQVGIEGIESELKDFRKINLIYKRLLRIYQALTYVICAGFTGWRASEVFSIQPKTLIKTPSGYYLSSNVIKTTQNKTELISRPIPDIVAEAILNLQELNNKTDGLFDNKIVKKNGDIDVLFKSPMGNALDLKALNEDLNVAWKYIGNNNYKFSTHQFRKFFAHFYIRRYKGTADAVRWNFRHISKKMILHYTSQAMNAKQLAQSKKEFAREIANSIVNDNQYTSIGIGNEIKDLEQKEFKAKVLTVEEASKYIEEKIDKEFKDIHAMEWGYCMFQNNYKGAACEAKHGPIESRSEPSTCGRCKFLCTGQEHISFWQQTILLHQDIVGNKFTTKIMKKESEKVLSIGTSILKRHN